MTIDQLHKFFLIGLGLNYVILLLWFFIFLFLHAQLHGIYRYFFKLDLYQFNASMYWMMGLYEIGIFLFYLAPLLTITLIK